MKRYVRTSKSDSVWKFDGWTHWGGEIMVAKRGGFTGIAQRANLSDGEDDVDAWFYSFEGADGDELTSVADRLTLDECTAEFEHDYSHYMGRGE